MERLECRAELGGIDCPRAVRVVLVKELLQPRHLRPAPRALSAPCAERSLAPRPALSQAFSALVAGPSGALITAHAARKRAEALDDTVT